jgi:hypothetical protein
MPDSEPLQKFVATAYEKGAVVGSVCHGPAAFANLKLSNGEPLVKGKKVRTHEYPVHLRHSTRVREFILRVCSGFPMVL